MAFSSTSSVTTIGYACTHHAGAVVAITVPQSGYVVVEAQVTLQIYHTAGYFERWSIYIGTSASQCAGNPWADELSLQNWDGNYALGGAVQRTFAVSAGTYSFYLNGLMVYGYEGYDFFMATDLVAVFYPT